MSLPKHPDRERELEVRVCDGTRLVEDTFNGFLRPRAILQYHRFENSAKFVNIAHRKLTGHNKTNSPFDWFSMRVFRVHESHYSPTCLYNLGIFMLDPSNQLARLPLGQSERLNQGEV
jgi:hypothetical protein